MKRVFICSAVRTPIGSFGGTLSSVPATKLGAITVENAIEKSGIEKSAVDELIMGHVYSANTGQSPGRQVLIGAGLPISVPAYTINKVCSSGLKAVSLGASSIMLGINDVVVAGGMENMSLVPYYLTQNRWGAKFGNGILIDGLSHDGLTDAYQKELMGTFADKTAEKYNISRKEQDDFTISSYKKSQKSQASNIFKSEIVGVEVKVRREIKVITEDEECQNVNFDKVPRLSPAFSKNGTVTAANSSTISDGAAALVLASEAVVKENNLEPLAEIVAFADAAHEPEWFTTAPVKSAKKILNQQQMEIKDIDFFEVNEAFSVVPLAYKKELGVLPEKMNINGGAVSLGHPLGASGARILTTLCHTLKREKGKTGMASICNGGGGATSILIKT